jgi:hypothetical protein
VAVERNYFNLDGVDAPKIKIFGVSSLVVILTEDRYYTGDFLYDRFWVSRTSPILA